MVWYLTPDLVVAHQEGSKTNKKYDNNSRGNQNYDFSTNKIQSTENKAYPYSYSSKPSQTLCSICNRSDRIVTDPESGEILCSGCGMVISDKVEDTSHLERPRFVGEQIDQT